MNRKVLFLGINGFPIGLAAVKKQFFLAKGLKHKGHEVRIISRYAPGWFSSDYIPPVGNYFGIDYIFCSGQTNRSTSWRVRNGLKLVGIIRELKILLKGNNIWIVSSRSAGTILYYGLVSLFSKSILLLTLVEEPSALDNGEDFKQRFNHFLYKNFALRFVDGFLPISTFLINNYCNLFPCIPYIKIPAAADFASIESAPMNKKQGYILYCGSAGYSYAIDFILSSFEKTTTLMELFLVVNGTSQQLRLLADKIRDNQKSKYIYIHSNLSDEELYGLYKSSVLLLIPLENSIRDMARFPQKIAEYVASGRPIVSTNVGEIENYFVHNETAFITEWDPVKFSVAIETAMKDSQRQTQIGLKAKQNLRKDFDCYEIGVKLHNFIITNYS